jgi:hypothetical protein
VTGGFSKRAQLHRVKHIHMKHVKYASHETCLLLFESPEENAVRFSVRVHLSPNNLDTAAGNSMEGFGVKGLTNVSVAQAI